MESTYVPECLKTLIHNDPDKIQQQIIDQIKYNALKLNDPNLQLKFLDRLYLISSLYCLRCSLPRLLVEDTNQRCAKGDSEFCTFSNRMNGEIEPVLFYGMVEESIKQLKSLLSIRNTLYKRVERERVIERLILKEHAVRSNFSLQDIPDYIPVNHPQRGAYLRWLNDGQLKLKKGQFTSPVYDSLIRRLQNLNNQVDCKDSSCELTSYEKPIRKRSKNKQSVNLIESKIKRKYSKRVTDLLSNNHTSSIRDELMEDNNDELNHSQLHESIKYGSFGTVNDTVGNMKDDFKFMFKDRVKAPENRFKSKILDEQIVEEVDMIACNKNNVERDVVQSERVDNASPMLDLQFNIVRGNKKWLEPQNPMNAPYIVQYPVIRQIGKHGVDSYNPMTRNNNKSRNGNFHLLF